MWCPNCGAKVRVGPVCERCGAPLPSEGRSSNARVEGPRQRAARRVAEGERHAPKDNPQAGETKRRGGTLGDFFNAQAQRQATRDRIPAAPSAPQPNQKVRRTWFPIRTRLSSGPIRGNTAKRGPAQPALPQFPQYPSMPDTPPAAQPQQREATYESYRQQAYNQQQAYDQPTPSQRLKAYDQPTPSQRLQAYGQPTPSQRLQAYGQAQRIEKGPQSQPSYAEYDSYTQRTQQDQQFGEDQQDFQEDIDDAWEVGYRATLGSAEEKGRRRGGHKAKQARRDRGAQAPDPRAMRGQDDDQLQSSQRGWNVVSVPAANQHISGPLSSSRHYVPMVPLEEMAAMPVPQGYAGDMRMRAPAGPRPEQILAGMSRLTTNLLVLGVVLCILAVPACIGIQRLPALSPSPESTSSAQKTAVPTPQLAQGFSGFLNDEFSIAYPSSWQQKASSNSSHTVSFTDGKDTSAKITTSDALPATELQQHLDEIAHGFNGVVPTVLATGQRKVYNKAVWLENDYALTLVRGNTTIQIELRVLTIDYNAHTYDILLSAPRADLSQTNNTYFEPMLQSFRFQ